MPEDDRDRRDGPTRRGPRGFFAELFAAFARDTARLAVAFALGTGAVAVVCLVYGLPLALAPLGGILVLGIALALLSDGPFS